MVYVKLGYQLFKAHVITWIAVAAIVMFEKSLSILNLFAYLFACLFVCSIYLFVNPF